jgi:hypothetical protein
MEWDIGHTEDWLLDCFFQTRENNEIKIGCIIELLFTPNFQNEFCSLCKNTLTDNIVKQTKYLLRNKRYNNNNNISIEENDNMKELQDLKDYLESIHDYMTYMSFALTLNKQENIVVSTIITGMYKTNEIINPEKIMKKINVKKRRFQTILNEINNKWILYNK